MAYPWPGNVRELRNTLLRAAYMARALGHRTIRADMLGLRTGDGDGMAIDSRPDAPTPSSGGFAHAFSDMMLLPEDDPSAAIPDTSEPGPRFRLQEEIARLEGLPLVEGAGLGEALDILERRLIVRALEENAWNRTKAAASLGGLSRTTLIGKMKRLGIEVMGPIGTEPTRA